MEFHEKNFFFYFTSFFAWTFLKFSGPLWSQTVAVSLNCKKKILYQKSIILAWLDFTYIEEYHHQQQQYWRCRATDNFTPRFEVSTPLREVMSWTPNSDEDGATPGTNSGPKLPKRFAKSAKSSREVLRSPLQEAKRPSTTSEGKTSILFLKRGHRLNI